MNEIFSRKEALVRGVPRYYTGKPCKRGHIAERVTANLRCVECYNDAAATDGGKEARKLANVKSKYGLSSDQYYQMLTEQKNCCAICRNPFSDDWRDGTYPCVDHCHTTQEVRGILCRVCNKTLGGWGDSITILENAIKYLRIFKC